MTRKKSNVKALALAVTCAILAGGYSGLDPVYAATPIYHDVVKYDSANLTLDYEFDAGAGTGTAAIQKINFGNIVLDGSSGAGTITATSLKLNGIGDVKTAIEGKAAQTDVDTNKNNIDGLKAITANISYNATTGTTVEGVVLKEKGISAAGGKFTVYEDGKTVFKGDATDNGSTTIKAGETVVKGANGTVTINNSGINIAQKEQDTNKDLNITLDSGYVKASGYVQAPKFYIDNNNVFEKEADGTSRLTVSDVGENGEVTKFVRIGGGNILASGDVNVAGSLNTNTIGEATTGTGVTVEDVKFKAGAVSGISDINDGIIKFTKNGTENIVQINSDLMFNDDAGRQAATLTLEGVKTLNGLSNGSSKIEAGNGSVVGGVTFDEKNITDINDATVNNILKVKTIQSLDGNNEITVEEMATTKYNTDKITYEGGATYINQGDDQQVVIDDKGLKVGKNSSRMNDITGFATSKNLYVGTADADNPTKDNSKFYVDGATGETVVKGSAGTTTIYDGAITIDEPITPGTPSESIQLSKGTVLASASVISPKFFVDPNNAFEKNSLKVGDGTKGVTIADGEITTTGDATVGGNLSVAGTSTFTGKTTFSGGINTDTIDEATADKGVTVDGVLLKDKGIDAADGKFNVDGASGNISTDGSVTAKGGLSAADGKFTVDADGAVKAAGGKFGVDKDGNTNVGGTLGVTGNASVGGTLGVTGAATLGSTLDVTGKATLKDELQVDKKATFGTAAGSQTVINGGDITADGKLTAKSATIGAVGITDTGIVTGVTKLTTKDLDVTGLLNISGNIAAKDISGDSLTVTGAIKGASLEVTGAVKGATINGATITTDSFNGAKIGATTFNGVTLTTDGDVSGRNMTASGTVTGTKITDGAGASMNAGTVTGTKITDGAGFTATGGKVTANDINATTGTIAGVGFTANNVSGINNLNASGTIQGATLKVNDNNLLDNHGLTAEKAVIDNLTIDGASITSNNADGSVGVAGITVDKTGAITGVKAIDGVAVAGNTASGLTIGAGATAVTIGGNSLALSSANFSVDDDGDVKGQSFTTTNGSYLKDNELKLNAANIWNTTEGIKAEKAIIGANTLNADGISTTGTLGVEGVATFGKDAANQTKITQGKAEFTQGGKTTTIKGGEIETDKLTVNDIVLKNSMKDGAGNTITISGSDGSMSVARGAFAVDKEGQLTNKITGTAGGFGYETKLETSKSGIKANYTNAINGNQNIIDMGANGISIGVVGTTPSAGAGFKAELDAATMGYGTANSIVVNKDTIKSALGIDVTRVMTNSATDKSIVDKVGTASRSLKADEIVDAAAGMTITTNNTGTTFSNGTNTTLINGSAITSTNGAATGVLNGSNLTLNDGTNSTALTAGGATFTGAAGEKGGTTTTINGGTITTDTLNVERINLGGEVIDKGAAGVEANSKLYMDAQGNFRAAGGNFKVNGADGAMTNTVGNTTLKTDANGAGMSYDNTAATGGVKANVSVADGKAEMAVGANAAVTATDGKVEIKGGTQTVTTTGAGTVFENSAHNTPFVTGGAANTVINGNEITTGKLTTDQLVITGSGAAAGTGSGTIALGGDGSITSNIKDATTGKEATFKTNAEGTFTEAKDGANVTTNTVNAQGNTNVVTDGTNTSTATQTATSIGGVVTNGTVKMRQELTADGMKVSVDGDTANYTQITNKDVSITDPNDAGKRIKLSDLGQLNDLDGELASRDEYQDNKTAVGAINAEAGIRREEVARLDNRIDDVNNRVDKVGAMAAAIASLKSIGYDPQAPSEFSIGLGQYKGETGVAMGFFHYPNKNFMINVSLSTAGGETMGGIGATWRFGHKSPQKLLEEQREAQARKELAAAEKYQAAAKLAKEAQERAEYAAKLARQAQVSADNAKAAADATQAKHFQ